MWNFTKKAYTKIVNFDESKKRIIEMKDPQEINMYVLKDINEFISSKKFSDY